jgi:hypothetical protein
LLLASSANHRAVPTWSSTNADRFFFDRGSSMDFQVVQPRILKAIGVLFSPLF